MAAYCDACGSGVATYEVSVMVESAPIGAMGTAKVKYVKVKLCEGCMAAMRKLLTRDMEQQARVARALTEKPRVIFRGSWRGNVQAVE